MKINEILLTEFNQAKELAHLKQWLATGGNAQIGAIVNKNIRRFQRPFAVALPDAQEEYRQQRKGSRANPMGGQVDPAEWEKWKSDQQRREKEARGRGKDIDDEKPLQSRQPQPDDAPIVEPELGKRQAGWSQDTHGHLRGDKSITQRARDTWAQNKLDLSSPGAAMASGGRLGTKLMMPKTSFGNKAGKLSIRRPKTS